MRQALKRTISEYGAAAITIYLAIAVVVGVGASLLVWMGWRPGGALGAVGGVALVYAALKLTQPIRIAATVVLTPIAARLLDRLRAGRAAGTAAEERSGRG